MALFAHSQQLVASASSRQSQHNRTMRFTGRTHLLALPREIRDMIYEYYIPHADPTTQSDGAVQMESFSALRGLDFLMSVSTTQDQLFQGSRSRPGLTPAYGETTFKILGECYIIENYCNYVLKHCSSRLDTDDLRSSYFHVRNKDPLFTRERAVCCQIMQESSEMLFGRNMIELRGSLQEVYQCLTNLHPTSRQSIRRLYLTIESHTEHTMLGKRCTISYRDQLHIKKLQRLLLDTTARGLSSLRVLLLYTEGYGDAEGRTIARKLCVDFMNPDTRFERLQVISHDRACRKCRRYRSFDMVFGCMLTATIAGITAVVWVTTGWFRWEIFSLSLLAVGLVWMYIS